MHSWQEIKERGVSIENVTNRSSYWNEATVTLSQRHPQTWLVRVVGPYLTYSKPQHQASVC